MQSQPYPCKLRRLVPQAIQSTKLKDHTRDFILAQIMTTKELAVYLRLHQITICKLSKEGKIPSIRIGRVWRFDKEVIDEWIAKG
jgi:excisionase family DNA binding protein